tara:strand:+ start:720 stop:1796 length:1077 start_codon:yes stop_codon:yes gene_type:complete
LKIFKTKFKNKKIIVTGHTGFKGSWLSLWLTTIGAKVLGISKGIPTSPSNFNIQNLKNKLIHKRIDIRDRKKVEKIFYKFQPDYVFHLAAQSLVKKSYASPINTFETNTIGTLNILNSLQKVNKKCVAILITSDKSYKNLELKRGYKENDLLGGTDPYSASKGSAEFIIQSYFHSYFKYKKNIQIGVARAGNVIGGGDWSEDRLVVDCIKSWSKNRKAILRNPYSTRPWQHVLEAVGGYLLLACKIKENKKLSGEVFNFGPNTKKNYNVLSLVKTMQKYWRNVNWKINRHSAKAHLESKLLKLNCNKSKQILKWKSLLNFEKTAELTINWYKKFYNNKREIRKHSINLIKYYQNLLDT